MPLLRPTRVSSFVVALLLSACSSSTAPVAGVEVRPAALIFTRDAHGLVEVPYAVVNGGENPVLITTRCGDRLTPAVQRLHGDAWVQQSGGGCFAIYPTNPVPLVAGARRDEVEFLSSAAPGKYRLVLGTELGPVVSATFTVQ